ncbi:MAG: 23S rRNA (adenine(2503)-C(2))-methyltransferase RlmN [Candidatus Tokpelaia sp.]|nr:MAG: 23S rRNA (adenine(2503)-C(2))-methyltransferase RlmN [Candidatus Tokpelaia sp.]KAA6205536.1 MAG: 23S rRNA (adenine(2503)-C(2))-methyltransferase RlmN [Candidatus Tokpelaia sp.]
MSDELFFAAAASEPGAAVKGAGFLEPFGAAAAEHNAAERDKPSLIGRTREELAQALTVIGVPQQQRKMRVAQLWHWLYVRGVSSFANISNLSRDFRGQLAQHFTIMRPEIVAEQRSEDGTRKWLLRFPARGAGRPVEAETVYIPEEGRGTLCVSSQVGCTLTCSFCHTGTQRLVRNLTAEEILAQFLVAKDCLGDFADEAGLNSVRAGREGIAKIRAPAERQAQRPVAVPADETEISEKAILPAATGRKITNIVMMGMGEPLYNFEAVKKALLIASDGEGLSLSRRRITLSTSGVVPGIYRTGAELGVMLAVSLHAVNDELRNMLVPINKKYPLAELMAACRNYPGVSNARRITFEYVMLRDVNDSVSEAKKLVQLLKGIPAKINLIPFNPWPGTNYQCSDWRQIELFADILNKAGYSSPIRAPRGRDIMAACGQLKSVSERLKKLEREALEAGQGGRFAR